jgi:MSHA biogenesis protein MshO
MRARGFTLVELITVIVVVAIITAVGSGFVVTALKSYQDSQQRAKLLQKGRLAIEQMTRQLRVALPYSLRVSGTGNCIEFMPIVGGANYLSPVPDTSNNAPTTTSIETSPVDLSPGLGNPEHVAVGALSTAEIYTTAVPAGRTGFASIGGPPPVVNLANSHRFIRNSINRRLFLTDDPMRFCVRDGSLWEHRGYGLLITPMDDGAPGAQTLMVSGVAVPAGMQAFALSGGSEDRNTAILMNLTFEQGGSAIQLGHQVLVRNVP